MWRDGHTCDWYKNITFPKSSFVGDKTLQMITNIVVLSYMDTIYRDSLFKTWQLGINSYKNNVKPDLILQFFCLTRWYIAIFVFCRFGLSNRFDHEFPQGLAAKVRNHLSKGKAVPRSTRGVAKFWKLVAHTGQWLTNLGGPDQI